MATVRPSAGGSCRLEVAERAVGAIRVDDILGQRGDITGGKRHAITAGQQSVVGRKQYVVARR